ncbi:Methyltransferase type 12 (plasmid) [Gloeothece citriformis PCC 7424]|uniref:Methyltransferase type 12 n=1 Tax=Gloeothece citriformis (strain PCC 7424) TaxID=65393 RepID=B7KLZ7_GLOC7|nr:class I SAM-dependent methyltransferase [Gloeothece citriformis]ACK73819.1 Methyltransferase type 12 [Gloeothece citriformis PCC 7424]
MDMTTSSITHNLSGLNFDHSSQLENSMRSSYNKLADIYNEIWDQPYDEEVIQLLEKFILRYLPQNAHILDLCCGTGNLIKPLIEKGYQVTGTDISESMLNYARSKVPDTQLILSDARFLNIPPTFHGVISLGSLNHFLSLEDLKKVFQNVFDSLLENGIFGFNIAMETMYSSEKWIDQVMTDVKDELIWIWKKKYDSETKLCTKTITILELIDQQWQRSDKILLSTVYKTEEIQATLEEVGFSKIKIYDLEKELNDTNKLGSYVFICHKNKK